MRKMIFGFLFFAGYLCLAQTKIKNVDAETFKNHMQNKNATVIDLRTKDEITRKGMIKGALQIDFLDTNARQMIAKLDRKKTYLIYCAGGGRSGDCAKKKKKMGFREVVNLEKGFDDWKRKGFEIGTK